MSADDNMIHSINDDATPALSGRQQRRSMSPVELLAEDVQEQKGLIADAGRGFQHHEAEIKEIKVSLVEQRKGTRQLQDQLAQVIQGLAKLQAPPAAPHDQLTRSGIPSIEMAKRMSTRSRPYSAPCGRCGNPVGSPECQSAHTTESDGQKKATGADPKNGSAGAAPTSSVPAQHQDPAAAARSRGEAYAGAQATRDFSPPPLAPTSQKRRVKFDAGEASSGEETDVTDATEDEGSDDEEDLTRARKKETERYVQPSVIMPQAHLEDPTMWEQYDLQELDRAMSRHWRSHVNEDNYSGRTALELMEVMMLWTEDPSDPQVVLRLIDLVSQTVLFNRQGPQAAEAFQEEMQKGQHSKRLREAFRKAAKKKDDRKTSTAARSGGGGSGSGARFNRDRDSNRGGSDRRSGGLFLGKDEYAKLSEEQRKQLAALRSAVKR